MLHLNQTRIQEPPAPLLRAHSGVAGRTGSRALKRLLSMACMLPYVSGGTPTGFQVGYSVDD